MTVEFLTKKKKHLRTEACTFNYFTVLLVQLTVRGLESWYGFGHTNFPPFSTWPIPFSSRTVDWRCVSVPEKVSIMNCRKLFVLEYPSTARRVTMWQLSSFLLYFFIQSNGLSPLCASSSFALLWLSTVDDRISQCHKSWGKFSLAITPAIFIIWIWVFLQKFKLIPEQATTAQRRKRYNSSLSLTSVVDGAGG